LIAFVTEGGAGLDASLPVASAVCTAGGGTGSVDSGPGKSVVEIWEFDSGSERGVAGVSVETEISPRGGAAVSSVLSSDPRERWRNTIVMATATTINSTAPRRSHGDKRRCDTLTYPSSLTATAEEN
jgi:hypothetical protein